MRPGFLSAAMAAAIVMSAGVALPAENHNHDHDHGHEHHHKAPHGGTLIAFGDEAAHVELVLDSTAGAITAYVLDGEAEKAIRIVQPEIRLQIAGGDVTTTLPVVLKAVASPLTGEKSGDTSQFAAADDKLKGKRQFNVTIEDISIKGATFKNTTSKFPEGNH